MGMFAVEFEPSESGSGCVSAASAIEQAVRRRVIRNSIHLTTYNSAGLPRFESDSFDRYPARFNKGSTIRNGLLAHDISPTDSTTRSFYLNRVLVAESYSMVTTPLPQTKLNHFDRFRIRSLHSSHYYSLSLFLLPLRILD